MYGNGDIRAHHSADAAAGALIGFLFLNLGRRIAHAVNVVGGSENFFRAEGNAEVATFAPFGIYHHIA